MKRGGRRIHKMIYEDQTLSNYVDDEICQYKTAVGSDLLLGFFPWWLMISDDTTATRNASLPEWLCPGLITVEEKNRSPNSYKH